MERICGQQNKCDSKIKICHGMREKIVGKGENAGYHFSHHVFKSFLFQGC